MESVSWSVAAACQRWAKIHQNVFWYKIQNTLQINVLIQNTKILVPENVTKYNTCILYLKYRKYLFWIFHFLTIWYSRALRFGLYNVHKALVNHTWLAWHCHTHNSSQNMSLILLHTPYTYPCVESVFGLFSPKVSSGPLRSHLKKIWPPVQFHPGIPGLEC